MTGRAAGAGGPDAPPPAPTFLGIGPGKSGTTWTYDLLDAHPQVFMSETKETLYFSEHFDRGRDWYLSFFEGAEAYPASGEISNTYVFSPEAARRAHDFNPDLKLVTCLRDPVDRAFSHYLWLVRNGAPYRSFPEAVADRPDLLERGLYARHLRPWLERFGRERLLVLPFWRLKEDPRGFARELLGFLGVDEDFFPEEGGERVLGAMEPRSRLLARLAKRGAVWARELGMSRLVTRLKRGPLARLLYRPYGEDRPELSPEERRRAREVVREDVLELEGLVGMAFAGRWLGKAPGGGREGAAGDGEEAST